MKNLRRRGGLRLALAAAACAAAPHFSSAANSSWTFNGNGSWSVGSNWLGGVPVPTSSAFIVNTDGLARTVTLNVPTPTLSYLAIDLTGPGVAPNMLSIPGDSLQLAGGEVIGDIGRGAVIQTGGTNNTFSLFLGNSASGAGTYALSNSGSLIVASELRVGGAGAGTMQISNGAVATSRFGEVGYNGSGIGVVTISGAGSTWNVGSGALSIDSGTVTVSNGGQLNSTYGYIDGYGPSCAVVVTGPNARWSTQYLYMSGYEEFNIFGQVSTLTVAGGASVLADYKVQLHAGAAVNLNGGTIAAATIELFNGGGTVNFSSGTVNITGSTGFAIAPGQALGQSLSLNALKALVVAGTTTISGGSSLSLDGGTFITGSLANSGVFQFNNGTFRLTNSAFNIGAGGILGGAVQLNPNQHLEVTGGPTNIDSGALLYLAGGTVVGTTGITNNGQVLLASPLSQISGGVLTNNGLISGSGRISNTLNNSVTGIVRASGAERLYLTGRSSTNDGLISLIDGGAVEFTEEMTNSERGVISGRGQFLAGGRGLANNGYIALSAGISDFHGDVANNSGAHITVSGQANATFWNDVTNDNGGTIKVSPGAVASFFGKYSGSGITGGGDIYFEDDLSPGFSPAAIGITGNVNFGSGSKMKIELAGKTRGTQYDAVDVSGTASLDGRVVVSTLSGFAPLPGDVFNILTFASRSGDVTVENQTPFAGLRFQKIYSAAAMQLVVSALFDGDANLDGMVDLRDLYALASHYNASGQIWTGGDFTNDGIVNAADLGILAGHWQAGVGSPPGAPLVDVLAALGLPAVIVPEPAGLLLLGAGFGSLLRRRRLSH